jgi:hypothetical protein
MDLYKLKIAEMGSDDELANKVPPQKSPRSGRMMLALASADVQKASPRSPRERILEKEETKPERKKSSEKLTPRATVEVAKPLVERKKSSETLTVKSPRAVVESRRRLSNRLIVPSDEQHASPTHSPRQSSARRSSFSDLLEEEEQKTMLAGAAIELSGQKSDCPLDDLSSSKNWRLAATDDDVDDFFKLN